MFLFVTRLLMPFVAVRTLKSNLIAHTVPYLIRVIFLMEQWESLCVVFLLQTWFSVDINQGKRKRCLLCACSVHLYGCTSTTSAICSTIWTAITV